MEHDYSRLHISLLAVKKTKKKQDTKIHQKVLRSK